MSKVIAITNQKGGSGKTTTTRELGFGLARKGKKVLMIDSDPQGSLSVSLGVGTESELEYSLCDVLTAFARGEEDTIDFEKGIFHHEEGVDLMPCNINLCKAESELNSMKLGGNLALRYYVDEMKKKYEYILIDCMPSLQILPLNAFACADSVLIPVKPDFLNVMGMNELMRTLDNVIRKFAVNPRLAIEGIVFTQVDSRRNNDRYFMDYFREQFGNKIRFFESTIPLTVKGSEVSFSGVSIYKYDAKSKLAESYEGLTEEVIADEQ